MEDDGEHLLWDDEEEEQQLQLEEGYPRVDEEEEEEEVGVGAGGKGVADGDRAEGGEAAAGGSGQGDDGEHGDAAGGSPVAAAAAAAAGTGGCGCACGGTAASAAASGCATSSCAGVNAPACAHACACMHVRACAPTHTCPQSASAPHARTHAPLLTTAPTCTVAGGEASGGGGVGPQQQQQQQQQQQEEAQAQQRAAGRPAIRSQVQMASNKVGGGVRVCVWACPVQRARSSLVHAAPRFPTIEQGPPGATPHQYRQPAPGQPRRVRYFLLRSSNQQNVDIALPEWGWATTKANAARLSDAYVSCDEVRGCRGGGEGGREGSLVLCALRAAHVGNHGCSQQPLPVSLLGRRCAEKGALLPALPLPAWPA